MNKACELSCDEAVLSFLEDKDKKAYGDTLISALKMESMYKGTLDICIIRNDDDNIKKVKRISKKKANKILKDLYD